MPSLKRSRFSACAIALVNFWVRINLAKEFKLISHPSLDFISSTQISYRRGGQQARAQNVEYRFTCTLYAHEDACIPIGDMCDTIYTGLHHAACYSWIYQHDKRIDTFLIPSRSNARISLAVKYIGGLESTTSRMHYTAAHGSTSAWLI